MKQVEVVKGIQIYDVQFVVAERSLLTEALKLAVDKALKARGERD